MKRIFGACLVGAMAFSGWAVSTPPSPLASKASLTPEQVAAKRAAAAKRMYERTGGFLVVPTKGSKVLSIVNQQKVVPNACFDEITDSIRSGLLLPIVVSDKRDNNAGLVIEVRDTDYPATFIVAPESGYGMVNVGQLKKDNPDAAILRRRVMQEVWRTLMYMLGAGNDPQPRCLMKPVVSAKELDEMPSICPCPVTFGTVLEAANRFGVKPDRRTTYRKAVSEGWAHQPTNDVQKAIWEEMKAKPTNPMKIKFDPKKGE